jgi:phospholipid/cholesterol/gamma-HCH transport system ATP-binding protein
MPFSKTPQKKPVAVEVRGLRKSYGDHEVLHGVDLQVDPGEIFVIMGASGTGKSVLLKHIIGLESPTSGEVLIDGLSAFDAQTHREIVTAIVFQDGALFNSMNVYDNLALYPREHRLYDRKTIDQKVTETLKILSLENAAYKMPSELSGGMKKRVSVARALMMEPQLLLYDEPTSELDPIMAATISELIASVSKETGLTSIVVSHDRDLSMTIGHRVALMHNGNVAFIGTPDELQNSNEPIVKDFLNPEIDLTNPRFRKTENGK